MTLTAGLGSAADARSSSGATSEAETTSIPAVTERPVRILHIINDLAIGGAEMMLYRLLSHKSRQRFDPIVI